MGAFEVTKRTKPNLKILMTFNFVAVAHTFGILIANPCQEDFCLWYTFRPLELDALWTGLCARCPSCTWISSCSRNTGWKGKWPIRHSWNPCWKSTKSKSKMCSLDSQLPRPLFACTGVTVPHGVNFVLRFETGRHETSRFSILFKTVVAVLSPFQWHVNFRISLLIGAIKADAIFMEIAWGNNCGVLLPWNIPIHESKMSFHGFSGYEFWNYCWVFYSSWCLGVLVTLLASVTFTEAT